MDDRAVNRTRIAFSSSGELAQLALRVARAVAAVAAAVAAIAAPESPMLVPVRAEDLCVTEGKIAALGPSGLAVDSPKMRAFLNRATGQSIEARFKYLGATAHESALGSGEIRRQFGIKLNTQDACNLIYAMWRIEPEPKLVVSVKANPGEHSSAECGNRGYRKVKPIRSAPVPTLRPGAAHALRAEQSGASMRVLIDGHLVWEGELGAEALRLAGPVGMRSDNARLEIELRSAPPLAGAAGEPKVCPTGGTELE